MHLENWKFQKGQDCFFSKVECIFESFDWVKGNLLYVCWVIVFSATVSYLYRKISIQKNIWQFINRNNGLVNTGISRVQSHFFKKNKKQFFVLLYGYLIRWTFDSNFNELINTFFYKNVPSFWQNSITELLSNFLITKST